MHHQSQQARDNASHQHTVREVMTFVGQGLHSGEQAIVQIIPAEPDSGIVFYRRDVKSHRSAVPALWDRVVDTRFSAILGNDQGVRVHTVKPVLAALYACGIDNACIMLDGPEVPVMDGSALPYVSRINMVGTVKQAKLRRMILVGDSVAVSDGHGYAEFVPDASPWISLETACDPYARGVQRISLSIDRTTFQEELAAARVLALEESVYALRAAGLAKGASNRNALVIRGGMILNEDGQRYPDELIRHKAAECIGDMSLAGARIIGRLNGCNTGHRINHALLCALMRQTDCWKFTTIAEASEYWRASRGTAS